MICSVCTEELTAQEAATTQCCRACMKSCGIVAIPSAMRPPAPCLRCGGRKFVHAVPREFTSRSLGDANGQMSAPMKVAYVPAREKRDYHDCNVIDIHRGGRGTLEMYACFGCGLVEWYCQDVATIPIHPQYMTEIVDYDAAGPYR
jgi:hypothetical protein